MHERGCRRYAASAHLEVAEIGPDAETKRETRRKWGWLLKAVADERDERAPAHERTPTPAE